MFSREDTERFISKRLADCRHVLEIQNHRLEQLNARKNTLRQLARLYEEYSDPRSAESALNAALAIDVRNWRAHAALGRLREQAGDYAQALQNYQMAYSINRFQPELHYFH